MPLTNLNDETEDEYRERNCPLCGADTVVKTDFSRTPERHCTECSWLVSISSPRRRRDLSEKHRIRILEREVDELRERIKDLEGSN